MAFWTGSSIALEIGSFWSEPPPRRPLEMPCRPHVLVMDITQSYRNYINEKVKRNVINLVDKFKYI